MTTKKNSILQIVDADATTVEIHLYGTIGRWDINAKDFIQQLKTLGRKSIDLHINSSGGEVLEGIAIYDALKNHRGSVRSFIDGYAVSSASFIAMAGDEISISPVGEVMIHDAMTFSDGPINPAECRKMLDVLERTSDKIAGIYAEKTDSDSKFWRKAMGKETWYNAKEAVNAGLADKIGRSNDSQTESNEWDFTIYNYDGRINAPDPMPRLVEIPSVDIGALFRNAMDEAVREVWG